MSHKMSCSSRWGGPCNCPLGAKTMSEEKKPAPAKPNRRQRRAHESKVAKAIKKARKANGR